MEPQEKLYNKLVEKGLYSKSFSEFSEQFSTPEKQAVLYNKLSEKGLYSKGQEDFQTQFFTQKKNLGETIGEPSSESSFTPVQGVPTAVSGNALIDQATPERIQTEISLLEQTMDSVQSDQDAMNPTVQEQRDIPIERDPVNTWDYLKAVPDIINKGFYQDFVGGTLKGAGELNAILAQPFGKLFDKDISAEDSWLWQAGDAVSKQFDEGGMFDAKTDPEILESDFGQIGRGVGQMAGMILTAPKSMAQSTVQAGNVLKEGAKQFFSRPAVAGSLQMVSEEGEKIRKEKEIVDRLTKEQYISIMGEGAGEKYDALKNNSTEDILVEMLPMTLAAGSTEAIPVAGFFQRMNKVTGGSFGRKILSKTGDITVGTIEGAAQEALQEYMVNLEAKEVYNFTLDVTENLEQAAKVGGGVQLVFELIGAALGVKSKGATGKDKEYFDRAKEVIESKEQKLAENLQKEVSAIGTREEIGESPEKVGTGDVIGEGDAQVDEPSLSPETKLDVLEDGDTEQSAPSSLPVSSEVESETQGNQINETETEQPIYIEGEYEVSPQGEVTKNGKTVTPAVATKVKKRQREAHIDRIATEGEYVDLSNVPEEQVTQEVLKSESPAQIAEAWRAEPDKVAGEESLRTEINKYKFTEEVLKETGRSGEDLSKIKRKYKGDQVTDLSELAEELTDDGRFGNVTEQDILDAIEENLNEGVPESRDRINPDKKLLEERFEELAKVPIDEEYADKLIERSKKLREEAAISEQYGLNDPKATIDDPGQGKTRRRGTQTGILERGRGLSEANEAIKKLSDETPDYYNQLNLKEFGKEIAEEIEQSGGIEATANELLNPENKPGRRVRDQAKRVIVLQGLGSKLSDAVKDGDWREINRLRNISEGIERQMAEAATEAGQQSAVLSLWYSTPEGQIARIVSKVRAANQAQRELISSSGEPTGAIIDKIVTEVSKQLGISKAKVKEAVGAVVQKRGKVGTSKKLISEGKKELADARKRLTKAAFGKATSGIDPDVALAFVDIVKALAKIFKGNLSRIKSNFMREAANAGINGKKYWEHIKNENPDIFESMESFNQKLEEAVHGFYNQNDLGQSLKEVLVGVGLSENEANGVANDFQQELGDYIEKEQKKKLSSIVRTHEKDAKKAKVIEDSLLKAIALGGLNEDNTRKAIEEKYGIKEITPEQISEITKIVSDAKALPGQKLRDKKLSEALDYIATDIQGESNVDIAVSLWFASVLSGLKTQASILLGGLTNITGLLLRIPQTGGIHGLRAMMQSMPFIWMEMGSIMRTGTSYKALDKIIKSPILERAARRDLPKDAGIKDRFFKQASKVGRYVGRVMNTIDANYYYSTASFLHGRAAYRSAKAEGLKGAAARKRANEIIAGTKEARNGFIEQAKQELAGIPHTNADIYYRAREIGEQKLSEVDNKAVEKGYELGQRFALMGEATGMWGGLAKLISNIPSAMVRSQEEVSGGKVSKGLAKMADVYSKITLPFLQVAANMTNLFVDYVPVVGPTQKLVLDRFLGRGVKDNPVLAEIQDINGGWNKIKQSEELRLLMMKQMIGTSLVLAIMNAALDDDDEWFDITAAGPKSWSKKSQTYEQALPPYHMKLGDKLIYYRDMPIAGALVMIGGMNDARKYEGAEKVEDQMEGLVSAFTGYFTSASFLQTIGEFAEALSGKKDAAFVTKVLQRPMSGFTNPAIIRHISNLVSPELRDSKTFGNDVMGKLKGHLIANTAIANKYLLDFRYNSLGQKIDPHKDMNWLTKGLGFDKYIKSAKTHDPIFDLLADKHLFFGSIGQNTKLAGTDMTYQEFRKYALIIGRVRKFEMDDSFSDLKKMEKDELQKYLDNLDKTAKNIGKNIVLEYQEKLDKLTPDKIDSILKKEYLTY